MTGGPGEPEQNPRQDTPGFLILLALAVLVGALLWLGVRFLNGYVESGGG